MLNGAHDAAGGGGASGLERSSRSRQSLELAGLKKQGPWRAPSELGAD